MLCLSSVDLFIRFKESLKATSSIIWRIKDPFSMEGMSSFRMAALSSKESLRCVYAYQVGFFPIIVHLVKPTLGSPTHAMATCRPL